MKTRRHQLWHTGLALGVLALLTACSHTSKVTPEVKQGLQSRQLYSEGMRSFNAQDYQTAIPYFQQAIQLQPTMDQAVAALAWSYYHLGQYREATYYFREALVREPGWKDMYDGLGWSRFRLGRFNTAAQAFQLALNQDPGYRDARIGLAFSEYELGDYADARPQLDQLAGERGPEQEEIRGRLAWTLFHLKEYDRAEREFRKGIAARPNSYDLYDGLGWTYLGMGRSQLAIQNFQQALRLRPDFRDAQAGMRLASNSGPSDWSVSPPPLPSTQSPPPPQSPGPASSGAGAGSIDQPGG